MPGDKKNPIDGKITVEYEELQAEGKLVGLTVAQVRAMLLAQVSEFAAMPADVEGNVMTMDPDDEAWKQVQAKEEGTLMSLKTDWGVQMFQGVSKDVPDTYVIRKADIFLKFRARTA